MIHDVAVIGAGPAGTSAAGELAKRFDSVLLLDRAAFPRKKLCAGVLPPRIHTLVDPFPEGMVQRRLTGYRVHAPSGRTVESRFPREGVMVDRESFDNFLLERCGVPFVRDRIDGLRFLADRVELTGEKETYEARLVIGADGVGSVVRRALDIPMERIAVAVQVDVSLPEEVISERVGGWFEVYYVLPQGYGWVSPMKDVLKVGMGGVSGEFCKDPKRYLEDFLEGISEKLAGGTRGPVEHWRIPMGGPPESLAGDRCILAGDAGGFVYPGTGEGVYYAMKSGQLAAHAAADAFDSGRFDAASLQNDYNKRLSANGLLGLRDVNFIEEVLATTETAEKYIKRLEKLGAM